MSFVATAIVGGVTALGGAAIQARGARDAADINRDQSRAIISQQQPFVQAGYGAQSRLNTLLGIAPRNAQGQDTSFRGYGGSPLNETDYGAIRDFYNSGNAGARNFADLPGAPAALTSAGASPEAVRWLGQNWDAIHGDLQGRNAGFDSVNWANVNGPVGYAQAPGAGAPGGAGDDEYGSLTRAFSPQDFLANQDPGYGFELQQGQQALLNSAAAGSGAMSGAALKDLIGYSQNFARTGYNDAFNRYQVQQGNIFSRLSDLAHLGQNAAAGVGAQGTALAGNTGQAVQGAATALGGGVVGAGNALTGAASNYWLSRQLGGTPPVATPTPAGGP